MLRNKIPLFLVYVSMNEIMEVDVMFHTSMFRKILIPIVYIVEWTFFFYMFLLIASFNLVNFTNVIAVDMPWEEPITLTSSFVTSLIIVLGVGLLCAVYLQFLVGSRVYKRLKRTIWGILFGFNAISCIVCTSIVYKFDLLRNVVCWGVVWRRLA